MNAIDDKKAGFWETGDHGLPFFNYAGKLPAHAKMKNGEKAQLPEDPWFLLGNYQLTLFTHVSGEYELLTGQRGWGRLNQGDKPNSGSNSAMLVVEGKEYELTGIQSLSSDPQNCKRIFGCGFADYTYEAGSITCNRNISVKPSTTPYNGTPAFLVTILLENHGVTPLTVTYKEAVTANFEVPQQQRQQPGQRLIKYSNSLSIDKERKIVKASINAISDDPLLFAERNERMHIDGFPPSLFMKLSGDNGTLRYMENGEIIAEIEETLQPGELKVMELVVGFSFDDDFHTVEDMATELLQTCQSVAKGKNRFEHHWLKVLPSFSNEKDEIMRREMIWNSYVLESMATYSEYFQETKIPQGTAYDYDWGVHASARDNYQHALPLVYYNPALAKSVLLYMMKRTTPWGEIKLIESGHGFCFEYFFFASDQQLYFFLLLSAYFRVTGDHEFLLEETRFYPFKNMPVVRVIDAVEACFGYLRDIVGTGKHGLIRLLNADWNDVIYHVTHESYNKIFYEGESHMNSAMAVVILKDLVNELEVATRNKVFEKYREKLIHISQSMELLRQKVLKAFMAELGDRKFSKRMYFAGKFYGEENMFLEPQGFLLQMNELPVERKKVLYKEMQERVYKNEKIGARQQESPQFDDEDFEKGSRENGGIWWALNGPVIVGVAQFDKKEAYRLLKNLSFDNFVKNFPDFWTSYWSQADNFESSIMPGEGLADQSADYPDSPVFCAHAHAWPLYCYFSLLGS